MSKPRGDTAKITHRMGELAHNWYDCCSIAVADICEDGVCSCMLAAASPPHLDLILRKPISYTFLFGETSG